MASLLRNWQSVEGATKASQNSIGSAEKEQAAYMDSISAKVNSFKETIVGLEQQLIDGNAVKGVVDFGTNALSVFTKLNSVVGTLPTLFATVSSIISVTGKDAGKQKYAHLLKASVKIAIDRSIADNNMRYISNRWKRLKALSPIFIG